ncbi:MAG: hypothetical protein IJX19_12665, partial [Clostridia bacterium]|nr:hypothetical protein [Clostridia bacterium]
MKKSLEHIFDEANASEIERLVDQNAAPDVSADTLASIKNKVYAKTGITKMKKKKPLIFRWQSYAAAAACLCLVFGLMFGMGILPLPVAYAAEASPENDKEYAIRTLINNVEVERKKIEDISLDENTLAFFIDEENNLVLMSSTEILFKRPIEECEIIQYLDGWYQSTFPIIQGENDCAPLLEFILQKPLYLVVNPSFLVYDNLEHPELPKRGTFRLCFNIGEDKLEDFIFGFFSDGMLCYNKDGTFYSSSTNAFD